ncbi:hypothetical protein JKP88DRAFT_264923 [Tribonema minus]|uniref:Transcription factor TFIIIC triple barrel domain-containing protein n=1 Tax=Tribonema minus TaxID=303371 RepID=A0A836C957_9STRA|nr:hypothetical protein JKP88DRAFT_264923 [Tribonema minus]
MAAAEATAAGNAARLSPMQDGSELEPAQVNPAARRTGGGAPDEADADSDGSYEEEEVLLLIDLPEKALAGNASSVSVLSYSASALELQVGPDTYRGSVSEEMLGTALVFTSREVTAQQRRAASKAAQAAGEEEQVDLELLGLCSSTVSLRKGKILLSSEDQYTTPAAAAAADAAEKEEDEEYDLDFDMEDADAAAAEEAEGADGAAAGGGTAVETHAEEEGAEESKSTT